MASPNKTLLLVAGLLALAGVGWLVLSGEAMPVVEPGRDLGGEAAADEVAGDSVSASPWGGEPEDDPLGATAPRNTGSGGLVGPTRAELGELSQQQTVRVRCVELGEPVAGVAVVAGRDRESLSRDTWVTSSRDGAGQDWVFDPGLASGGPWLLPEFDSEGWRSSAGVTDVDGWVELALPTDGPWLLRAQGLGRFPVDDWARGKESLIGRDPLVVRMLPMLALVARPRTSARITFQQTHAITGAAPGLGLQFHRQHELAWQELQKRFPGCLVSVALDGELPLDAQASFKAHTADGVAWRLEHPMRPYHDWREPVRMVSHDAEGHGLLTVAVRERGTGRVLPLGVRVESSANHRYLELQPGARFVAKEGTWKISESAGLLHKAAGAFPVLVEIAAGQRHHEEIWIDGPLVPVRLRPILDRELRERIAKAGGAACYLFTNEKGDRVSWTGTAEEARAQTFCLPVGRWTVEVPDHSERLAFELAPEWVEPVILELKVTMKQVRSPR